MKNIHLNSTKELEKFLRLYDKITENAQDPAVESFNAAYESDQAELNLKPVKTEKRETNEEDEVEIENEEEEVEVKEEEPAAEVTASLDNLIRNINNLRSGESLKDAEVRDQVRDYYDKLSEDEQGVLVLFFREMASVLTRTKDGSQAQDPSASPTDYIIQRKGKEEAEEKPAVEEEEIVVDKSRKQSEEEDDTAPIRVNESQDFTYINKKIKKLIVDK